MPGCPVEDPLSFPDELLAGDEQVARRFRSHPWMLAASIAWSIVFTIIAVGRFTMTDLEFAMPAVSLLILAFLVAGLINLIATIVRWATTVYIVTTDRIMWRTGLIRLSTKEIPLAKIDSIQVDVGLVGRLLHCGTFVMRSANLEGKIKWPEVPEAREVHAQLAALIKADREAARTGNESP